MTVARELIAGNGGWWDRDAAQAQAPGITVLNQSFAGDAFDDPAATVILWSGGVELAGTAPALAVADLGGVGPSRHPVGAVAAAHNSTETPAFVRHVECVDCHDPHEATSTVGVAPLVYGRLKGVFGVDDHQHRQRCRDHLRRGSAGSFASTKSA